MNGSYDAEVSDRGQVGGAQSYELLDQPRAVVALLPGWTWTHHLGPRAEVSRETVAVLLAKGVHHRQARGQVFGGCVFVDDDDVRRHSLRSPDDFYAASLGGGGSGDEGDAHRGGMGLLGAQRGCEQRHQQEQDVELHTGDSFVEVMDAVPDDHSLCHGGGVTDDTDDPRRDEGVGAGKKVIVPEFAPHRVTDFEFFDVVDWREQT